MFAARLVSAVTAPMMFKDHEIVATASVGVALAPADGTDPERLLKSADLALYKSKADGRNCIQFFMPEMDVGVAGAHRAGEDHSRCRSARAFCFALSAGLRNLRIAASSASRPWYACPQRTAA